MGRSFARTVCCDGMGHACCLPAPQKEKLPADQTDGDFDACHCLLLSLCLTSPSLTKTCRARCHRNGARIRPYSSLYGHDLTNVDISGGGQAAARAKQETKMMTPPPLLLFILRDCQTVYVLHQTHCLIAGPYFGNDSIYYAVNISQT